MGSGLQIWQVIVIQVSRIYTPFNGPDNNLFPDRAVVLKSRRETKILYEVYKSVFLYIEF